MGCGADDEDMIAVFILIGVLVLIALSVPFGADSRHDESGYHRPNLI